MRYADRLGDFITDDYFDAESAAGEADLAALARDRPLEAERRPTGSPTTCSNGRPRTRSRISTPEMLALTVVRPINHFCGFHTFYPTFASGKGAAPFKTVADYENNLKRHKDYVAFHDRAIGRFREGMTSRRGRDQADHPERHRPARRCSSSRSAGGFALLRSDASVSRTTFSEADKARLTTAYRASIRDEHLSGATPGSATS